VPKTHPGMLSRLFRATRSAQSRCLPTVPSSLEPNHQLDPNPAITKSSVANARVQSLRRCAERDPDRAIRVNRAVREVHGVWVPETCSDALWEIVDLGAVACGGGVGASRWT